MENELWMPISDAEGYSVSNYGRIRNDATNRILKVWLNKKDGHYQVTVRVNGHPIMLRPHRAMAFAFGLATSPNEIVVLKDGNPDNMVLDNLIIGTYKDFRFLSYTDNLLHYALICGGRKPKPIKDLDTGIVYPSCSECEKHLGICKSSIYRACGG